MVVVVVGAAGGVTTVVVGAAGGGLSVHPAAKRETAVKAAATNRRDMFISSVGTTRLVGRFDWQLISNFQSTKVGWSFGAKGQLPAFRSTNSGRSTRMRAPRPWMADAAKAPPLDGGVNWGAHMSRYRFAAARSLRSSSALRRGP